MKPAWIAFQKDSIGNSCKLYYLLKTNYSNEKEHASGLA